MSKIEKVRIELPNNTVELPIKCCKTRNNRPMTDKWHLVPKYIPFLSKFMKEVSWNCAEKTIDIEISETAGFDAYNWFGGINKRMQEAQKSSFVDMDQDSLLLVFMDECEKQVASIKFCGLQLVKHFCYLSNAESLSAFGIDENPSFLCHSVSIKYTECEMMPNFREEEEENFRRSHTDENEIVDEEWQEVLVS